MFSILKWYALTIGAWKRYKWWKSLPALTRFDILLKRLYIEPIKRELHRENTLLKWDMHRDINRQYYGADDDEEKWRRSQVDTMLCNTHTQDHG